jgi:hypothetical protein
MHLGKAARKYTVSAMTATQPATTAKPATTITPTRNGGPWLTGLSDLPGGEPSTEERAAGLAASAVGSCLDATALIVRVARRAVLGLWAQTRTAQLTFQARWA